MNSSQKTAVHLIQMHVTGWQECDFDQLSAVSGSSALFGHQPGEFTPKYAHLSIGIDQRIAEATGFGYTRIYFNNIQKPGNNNHRHRVFDSYTRDDQD
jgi:hypothetical protein